MDLPTAAIEIGADFNLADVFRILDAELGRDSQLQRETVLAREHLPTVSVIHRWLAFGGPAMLTKMTEEDWVFVLEVFHACRSRRGDKGRDDHKFFEALHYFTVHNITWRAKSGGGA
jgi:hypothetical protein